MVMSPHDLAAGQLDSIPPGNSAMKAAILVFPGINRERDMARALKLISGHEPARVWHAEPSLPAGTDLVVVPGGFSYGDYLRCGAIAARAPVMDAVRDYAAKGGPPLRGGQRFQNPGGRGRLSGGLMRDGRVEINSQDGRRHRRGPRSTVPGGL